ncbi:MAG: hypothetical protein CMH03_10740 [Marinovum sp.]|nr:hypothetical protein [Marinovum sp.]OUV75678.1 MAG: hypothetical protein CBC91_07160 [Rickettsiales bacterium TMED131]|tara:strand:- start:213 stop:2768 length:2556 start_codon:yes stop_codon:yes gene_type:complete
MAKFSKKVTNLLSGQVPEFVLSDHPKFLEFLKAYYTFMESAELGISESQSTDGILLETETGQSNNLLLDASRLGSEATQIDTGDKILQEQSSYGKFTFGEIIKGQTSNAEASILQEDLSSNRLIISAQDKFIDGETIVGLSSGASGIAGRYKPNPVQSIQDLLNFRDPDKVIQYFLSQFRNEFLNTIPEDLADGVNKRELIKRINSLYRTKGTAKGHELFFRLLFGINSEVFYPREQMLRVSDGEFTFNKILRCITPIGDNGLLIGRQITGETSGATAMVENVTRFNIGDELVSEFLLGDDSIVGTFQVGEKIRGTATDTDDLYIKSTITGIPGTFTITNDGSFSKTTDTVELIGGGLGSLCQVNSIGQGPITSFYINAAGTQYQIGDQLVFNNANTDGGGAIAEVAVVNGAIAGESSTGYDHIIFEEATSRNDINPGDKIVLESGLGDITDIRLIDGGTGYKTTPTVSITSTNGVNAEIYPYGDEIGKLLEIKIAETGRSHETAPTPPTVSIPQSIIVLLANGSYVVGETVTGGSSGSTGVVIGWDNTRGLLRLKSVSGTFTGHEVLTGSTSGTTGLMAKTDPAVSTVDVVSVATSEGRYISEDGHLSETTMKIQDSLYFQDFSYVIKVGRTIDEWRDAFKKTMHPAGFYFTGQVNIESRINSKMRMPVIGRVTGVSASPFLSILNTLFGSVFGRRLGTNTDGTTQRANALLGVPGDVVQSAKSPFSTTTRDVTLSTVPISFRFQFKPFYNFRTVNTNFGSVYAGPKLKGFDKRFQGVMNTSAMNWARVAELKAIGTNTPADGTDIQYGDLSTIAKTYITMPVEILVPQGRFSNTQRKFDSNVSKFDSSV